MPQFAFTDAPEGGRCTLRGRVELRLDGKHAMADVLRVKGRNAAIVERDRQAQRAVPTGRCAYGRMA